MKTWEQQDAAEQETWVCRDDAKGRVIGSIVKHTVTQHSLFADIRGTIVPVDRADAHTWRAYREGVYVGEFKTKATAQKKVTG